MTDITKLNLTVPEFRRKPFLNNVYDCPFSLKLYLLSDKSEEVLLSSLCYYLSSSPEYYSPINKKTVKFIAYNYRIDELLEVIEIFYNRCYELTVNKKLHRNVYLNKLKRGVIKNWDFFSPNIRRSLKLKLNKANLRTLC